MSAFSSYKAAREQIADKCESVEKAWEAATSASEFEIISTGGQEQVPSEVSELVSQARLRLGSDTIEVGIFGEVKRGKSTLINALVGRRVSSMRVTPETAVPVWVESGPTKTLAFFSDGSTLAVEDSHEAQQLASQRHNQQGGPEVVRVVQFAELAWLPEGLRIVDTPGLQDPSLIDSYEQRTMSELERVSAAIFMFVSPPGPASHEVQFLRKLAVHGIDKVFLVCNFYPDVWNEEDDRKSVLDYVQKVVVDAAVASSEVAPKDIRLYAVNAKLGLTAIEEADDAAYEASGVAGLRRDLEDFLTRGALQAVTAGANERLARATSIVRGTLDKREQILNDPSRIESAVRDLDSAVEKSKQELQAIERTLTSEAQNLGTRLGDILSSPYESAMQGVAGATTIPELETAMRNLGNLASGALSQASTEFERSTAAILADAENRLIASFGAAESFASAVSKEVALNPGLGVPALGSVSTRINWSEVVSSGVISGGAAAVAGGSLAGGAGLALLATGPVGWAIGAIAMGVVGLLGGSILGLINGVKRVTAQERTRVTGDLSRMMREARDFGKSQGAGWGDACVQQLRSQRDRYLGDKTRELNHVKSVVRDTASRDVALLSIRQARERLADI
jgi:Dynamin family